MLFVYSTPRGRPVGGPAVWPREGSLVLDTCVEAQVASRNLKSCVSTQDIKHSDLGGLPEAKLARESTNP